MGARSGVQRRQSTDVRVMYVDGEPDDAVAELAAADGFEVEDRDHAAAAIDALETGSYDCVVSGYDLTQLDGLAFLEEIRERWPDLPFVLYTDNGSERVASDAFSAGATDYVEKARARENPSLLRESVCNAVQQAADSEEASDDALSGLGEAGLQTLFEKLPDPAIRIEFVGDDAVVRDVNAAFEETFGYEAESLVDRSAGVLQVPAETDEEASEGLGSAAEIDTTVTRVTPEGTRAFRYRTVPYTTADGTTGVFALYADRADDERTDGLAPDRLDAALERTETGAWAWEPGSDRFVWHDSTAALFGIGTDATEGALADVLGRVHPVDRERVEDAFQRALDDGRLDVEFRVQTPDGERRWLTGRARTRIDDSSRHLVGVFVDVTARRQREEELSRYRRIVEATSDPVYILDEDGRFEFVNDAFVAETGFESEQVVGEHVSMLLDDADVEAGETIIRALRDSDVERGVLECELETAHGASRWCEINIALLESDGEIDGTVGVVRDITERKEREQELERQTERLEEFASVVAHDLRNPLTVAIGHTEVLQEEYDDEFVDRIADAHERMERLIDDLLALAREGRIVDETESVAIRTVATAAWETVATADAELVVDTTATVEADPDRLRTLFENLFRNSIDHGGEDVTVTVGTLDDGDGFFVADDGPGVPEDDREAIFERGFSTDEEGTGFGLAIVDRIADAHGWDVRVAENEPTAEAEPGTKRGDRAGGARFEVVGIDAE